MTADDYGDPGSYFTISRGVPVITSDGVEIGRVKRVLIVHVKNVFDGIVVSTKQGDRFVDGPEVARIYERAVILSIDAEEASALPRPGETATAGPRPIAQRLEHGIRRRLRRFR
jgi:sporulation protein YlmC with PRC-barrel domain